MKGHIRERSPGHFAIVLEIRDPDTGLRKRKWHSFSGHQAGRAARVCSPDQCNHPRDYVEPQRTTLKEYFDGWLEHVKTQVSPRSYERYCELARKNIVPLLGSVVLTPTSVGDDLPGICQGAR